MAPCVRPSSKVVPGHAPDGPVRAAEERSLARPRPCSLCRARYTRPDPFYDALCP